MLAITHVPSPHMQRCQRTFVAEEAIDCRRAADQHRQYCDLLRQIGVEVQTLREACDMPDCAFVEDTAIVLDEVAVLASMGAEARRSEPARIEPVLRRYREVRRIELPAAIEGGDVLPVGRTLLVGLSGRTDAAGIAALERIVRPFGYRVRPVGVHGCLHLKTACSWVQENKLLVNPEWVDRRVLRDFELIPIPDQEPFAANVARINDTLLASAAHPRTADLLQNMGHKVQTVEISEYAKAEGGVTCLSLIFSDSPVDYRSRIPFINIEKR